MASSQRTWVLSDDRRRPPQQSLNLSGYNNPRFGEGEYHMGDDGRQTFFTADSRYEEDAPFHTKPFYQGDREYVYQQELENPTSPHQPSYTKISYSTPNPSREKPFQSPNRYHYGTRIGSLPSASERIIQKELLRISFTKVHNPHYRETFLGHKIIQLLKGMEDGLTFVILLYIVLCVFVAVAWFLLASIPQVRVEITKQEFSSAFYPIVFLIAIIVGENFRRSVSSASNEAKEYAKILFSIRKLAENVSMLFKRAHNVEYGIGEDLVILGKPEVYKKDISDSERLEIARKHRDDLLACLLTLSYHSYACMRNSDLRLDANYILFGIYKGEVLLYKELNWTRTRIMTRGPRVYDSKIFTFPHLLLSQVEEEEAFKIAQLNGSTIRLIPKNYQSDNDDVIFVNQSGYLEDENELNRRRGLHETYLKYYTIDELRVIEYHFNLEGHTSGYTPDAHKKALEHLTKILHQDPFNISTLAIRKIEELTNQPEYKSSATHAARSTAAETSALLANIWIDQNTERHYIYDLIFRSIISFYLLILVPLQVISATNRYWALVIIPIIIMIYVTVIIVYMWLGSPFEKQKEELHPPYRQWRSSLCEQISMLFGVERRAIYCSPSERSIY